MKRRVMLVLMVLCCSWMTVSCGMKEENAKKNMASEQLENKESNISRTDLTGVWISEENQTSYQEAIITEDRIEINWVSDEGKTKSIYWVGSYIAPKDITEEYSWTSQKDDEETVSAIFASNDDTKDFTYKDGKISYRVSALGTTTTIELTQISKDIPEEVVTEIPSEEIKKEYEVSDSIEQRQQEKDAFQITYQNVLFYQDSIGSIYAQSIVEVENISENNLYLDSSSYELRASDGTIIHTTSNLFIPCPQIIAPGEKGYYYEEAFMDAGTPMEGISITPHIETEIAKTENIRLEIENTEIYDKEMGGIDLHGTVKNVSDIAMENVYVVAILFDVEGRPIGKLWSILMNSIEPGEDMGFELEQLSLPENITKASIADYKVFAYPQQYQF